MSVALKNKTEDRCLVFAGINWSQMETIEAAFADIAGVKFVYLDSLLEIVTVSPEYEDTKGTIRALLEAYLRESGIRFYIRGGPTLGSREIGGRKEPDESYNLHSKKGTPDLVIEVVISSGAIDKLELYKRLDIPEVWLWEDGVLAIYYLQGEYERVNRSVLLPELDIALLVRYITYFDQYDAVMEFVKALKQEKGDRQN